MWPARFTSFSGPAFCLPLPATKPGSCCSIYSEDPQPLWVSNHHSTSCLVPQPSVVREGQADPQACFLHSFPSINPLAAITKAANWNDCRSQTAGPHEHTGSKPHSYHNPTYQDTLPAAPPIFPESDHFSPSLSPSPRSVTSRWDCSSNPLAGLPVSVPQCYPLDSSQHLARGSC